MMSSRSRSTLGPVMAMLAVLAAGGSVEHALAQSATRPSPSPVAPADTGKPMFDTASPTYGGTHPGLQAGGTIVGEVDGRAITLAEVGDRIKAMPQNIANLPFDILFPNMLEQLIRREALVLRALRRTYDEDPVIRRRMKAASDEILANETILRETGEIVTDARMLERYRHDYMGKPGPEEAHVRVLVVPTEEEATQIITRLRDGADFATLAKELSKDSSASIGGDLGFLTRDGLNPEIATAAFLLAPGQITPYPVRSAGTWFIVKTEVRRRQPTPPYASVKETLRQTLTREIAHQIIRAALADVTVREYDMAGKELTADNPIPR